MYDAVHFLAYSVKPLDSRNRNSSKDERSRIEGEQTLLL